MSGIFIQASKNDEGKWLHARVGFANHLVLIAYFHITQETSVEVEVSIQDPHLFTLMVCDERIPERGFIRDGGQLVRLESNLLTKPTTVHGAPTTTTTTTRLVSHN